MSEPTNWQDNVGEQVNAAYLNSLDALINSALQPGGPLGTPSSGNLANCTFPTLNQNTTGSAASLSATLPVNKGGTGAATLTSGALLKGAGTSAVAGAVAGTDYVAPGGALGTPSSGNVANCTGFPGPPGIGPADFGWGGWSHDLSACSSAGLIPGAGSTLVVAIPVRGTQTITNIILGISVAGATLTSGENFAGLFQSGSLLAATADQTTNWQSAGLKVMALTSPQVVNGASGVVYAAWFTNGTTRPTFIQASIGSTAWSALAPSSPLMRYAFDSTNTGRTTSFQSTLGTLTATTPFWAAWS